MGYGAVHVHIMYVYTKDATPYSAKLSGTYLTMYKLKLKLMIYRKLQKGPFLCNRLQNKTIISPCLTSAFSMSTKFWSKELPALFWKTDMVQYWWSSCRVVEGAGPAPTPTTHNNHTNSMEVRYKNNQLNFFCIKRIKLIILSV